MHSAHHNRAAVVFALMLAMCLGCGRGARVLETTPKQQVGDGTVTGIVTGPDGKAPLANRLVEAVNVTSAERLSVLTNTAGGYTLKLPPGTYRIQLRLEAGESLAKRPPGSMAIEVGEIETRVDFTVNGAARSR